MCKMTHSHTSLATWRSEHKHSTSSPVGRQTGKKTHPRRRKMSRGGSSGGGRSSLGYLFEPEETAVVFQAPAKSDQESAVPAKSDLETEKTPGSNGSAKDEKMMADEADHQEPPLHPAPPKQEVSNPIVSLDRPPCNIYHTSQLSHNSGLLITDRPSTRVRCAPGGPSSLGFLFGDEHEK